MTKNDEKKVIGITVGKDEDFVEWYSEVVLKAELADYSPIKGFMVIRPYGYRIWEKIQSYFDDRIKKLGVKNAYFPLLIPESFFKKEAEHAEGFAPELAWIEQTDEEGQRLAIRPTSETIMYDMYSKWIRSHRDLPLRINQWCNVLRWEVKQTKPFLRTREFLWQEGHCVYETEEECQKEALMYLNEYQKVASDLLCIYTIAGSKTEKEKFPGAKITYTYEALMPDGKALQMGTSHNLGQGFAKSFGISFLGKDEKPHTPWQNSWGISTRLIGAMIMAHGDDRGLVIPPKVAPIQVVIVPIYFDKNREEIIKKCKEIKKSLSIKYDVELDDRDEYSPGWKFNEWELKGVPVRMEFGPKDMEKDQAVLVRRDNGEKQFVKLEEIPKKISKIFEQMEMDMFKKSKKFTEDNTVEAGDWKDFAKAVKDKKLVKAYFCGDAECEDQIKDKTGGATSRCVPLDSKKFEGKKCVQCGKDANVEAYFSKSY
jgi:prolyl-tRNA synthetase